MSEHKFSRRNVLAGGVTGLALLGIARASAAADAVCADPKAMDSGQRSIRMALNYSEVSKDPAKTCSGCAFFSNPKGGCGDCKIFSGPTNAKGHCDSYGQKE